jgi:hypothetical protein
VTEFSNLLRQRLASGSRARVRPESHPDADTLTAYVERLLPAAERNQVLAHLAACSDCREAAALALPEPVVNQEAAAVPAPAARRWGFLWSPWFRFAAALPIVVIVATVLLKIPHKPADQFRAERPSNGNAAPPATANEKPGLKDNNAPEVAGGLEAPAAPAANASADTARSNLSAVRDGRAASSHADAKAAPLATMARSSVVAASGQPVMAGGVAAPLHSDYVNQGFFANNASPDAVSGAMVVSTNGAELPSAPPPRTSNQFPSPTVSVANIMDFANAPTQNTGTQMVKTFAPPSRSSHLGLAYLTALGPKAKSVLKHSVPAIPPGATSFAMGGVGQLNPNVSEAAAAAPPLDGGVSALEQSGAFRRRALSDGNINMRAEMLRESAPSPWVVSGGKLVRPGEAAGTWIEACAGSGTVQFSTVSAHGKDIWAGGANAALIHSSDGGATCEQITLGASAIGTIVHIEVRGAVIQVKSSSGQSWSSQDGGKTWKIDE